MQLPFWFYFFATFGSESRNNYLRPPVCKFFFRSLIPIYLILSTESFGNDVYVWTSYLEINYTKSFYGFYLFSFESPFLVGLFGKSTGQTNTLKELFYE